MIALARLFTAISLIHLPIAYAEEDPNAYGATLGLMNSGGHSSSPKDTYTVNFNSIAIPELIRFASKITGLNFVFEEGDLQFSATVVSEDPVTSKNIIAILSQILRMNDLILLEEEGNVLITKSTKVAQIPPIVSSDLPGSNPSNAALVTRVFRIKNANPNSLAAILRPMISQGALIEVSAETSQLIVTDITTNVEQIASLLLSLDSPHSPLDVEVYAVKNIAPKDLILFTEQVLNPFTEGNPLIFVAQANTNSIFIVSTPYLIEKARAVMEDLDIPAKLSPIGKSALTGKDLFIYKSIYLSPAELLEKLSQIKAQLHKAGGIPSPLEIAISGAKEVKDANSVMFIADVETTTKLKNILASLDSSPLSAGPGEMAKSTFLVYNPQHRPGAELQSDFNDIKQNLSQSKLADRSFLASLESMKWIPSTNSLLFTGDPHSIGTIQEMLKSMDTPNVALKSSEVFVYKPKYATPDQIKSVLDSLIPGLENAATLSNNHLIDAIHQMQWNPENHAFFVTTDPATALRLKNLLSSIDTPQITSELLSKGFFLYKLQNAQCNTVLIELKNIAKRLPSTTLQNQNLLSNLDHIECIPSTNSLLIVGSNDSIEHIKTLIAAFDVPSGKSIGKETEAESVAALSKNRLAGTFLVYNPKYISGEELISILCDFKQNLIASGVSDPGLFDTIDSLKWIDKTSSLLISGDQQSIDKVQELLTRFDSPSKECLTPFIGSVENTSFLVYKLRYHAGKAIQNALHKIASKINKDSSTLLVEAINSLQWIKVTNSLLCSGPPDILGKIKELIQSIDIPLRQVFIEVLVIETSLENQQNFGLQWGGQVQYFNKTILQTGNFPVSPSHGSLLPVSSPSFPSNLQGINATKTPAGGVIPFTSGFDLGVIGDIIMHKGKSFISLGSLLNALQQDSDATVLLNPKIITQDNRQSTVFIGQNLPFTSSVVTTNALVTTTSGSTNQTSVANLYTANVEYMDTGITLTITPILGDSDIVTMDIVQDISIASGNINDSTVLTPTTQAVGIQTERAHMETRVHVPSNHFIALSGMINDTKNHFRTGIPCLGGLPVIGTLFSENDRGAIKNNIIIFVRPQIVNTIDEYEAITEHQEWLYEDNARIPELKNEFIEGLDMVKP